MGDQLITIDELAAWLQIPKATIYARRHRGESMPPAIIIGNHLRWATDVVVAWLEGQSETASRP